MTGVESSGDTGAGAAAAAAWETLIACPAGQLCAAPAARSAGAAGVAANAAGGSVAAAISVDRSGPLRACLCPPSLSIRACLCLCGRPAVAGPAGGDAVAEVSRCLLER
eukprot:362251-Chlamydomonas_euryale.AAC.9